MIVIQRLVTIWTKKSRGGEAASRRNQTPEALLLPEVQIDATSECGIHDVRFEEAAEFGTEETWLMRDRIVDAFPESPLPSSVTIRSIQGGFSVGFKWKGDCGLPERPSRKRLFSLKSEEWGRIIYNGRFVVHDVGSWYYEKKVINIGNFQRIKRDIFLSTKPNHSAALMADLF